jgi:hypothetical protein
MGGCVKPKTYLLLAAFSLMIVSSAVSRTDDRDKLCKILVEKAKFHKKNASSFVVS